MSLSDAGVDAGVGSVHSLSPHPVLAQCNVPFKPASCLGFRSPPKQKS